MHTHTQTHKRKNEDFIFRVEREKKNEFTGRWAQFCLKKILVKVRFFLGSAIPIFNYYNWVFAYVDVETSKSDGSQGQLYRDKI